MKNLRFFATVLLLVFSFTLVYSQTKREEAKKLTRPKPCGVCQYDEFMNSSFDLKDQVLRTDIDYDKLTSDIEGYISGDKAISIDAIKSDISKVKRIKESLKTFDDRVVELTKDGNELLEDATKVKPVTKVKPATSNTKDSLKAVDISKGLLGELGEKVEEDVKKLEELLAKAESEVEEEQ